MVARAKEHRSGESSVFQAMGFAPIEAAMLTARSALVDVISDTIERRGLTRAEAAKICKARPSLFGKVLRGRIDAGTIDMLMGWLNALGCSVELRVRSHGLRTKEGKIRVFFQQ